MRRIAATVLILVLTLTLFACGGGGELTISSDADGVHVRATDGATGSAAGNLTVSDDNFGIAVNYGVEVGSFHVTIVDADSNTVFDEVITNNDVALVDARGDFDVAIGAEGATGAIEIGPYDRRSDAQTNPVIADAIKEMAGRGTGGA